MVFTKFSHFAFTPKFRISRKYFLCSRFIYFREKVCKMRPKIFAFFRETFRSLETLVSVEFDFNFPIISGIYKLYQKRLPFPPFSFHLSLFMPKRLSEGRKASHNNFTSEPHSSHFLVRATSKSSSFQYYFF